MSQLKVQLDIIMNLLYKIFLEKFKRQKETEIKDKMLSIMRVVNNNPDYWAEIICVVLLNMTSLVAQSVCLQCRNPGFDPWVGKIPWRRKWQPTPVLLPRKSHGRRSLVQATVHGVAKNQTRLSDFTFTFWILTILIYTVILLWEIFILLWYKWHTYEIPSGSLLI